MFFEDNEQTRLKEEYSGPYIPEDPRSPFRTGQAAFGCARDLNIPHATYWRRLHRPAECTSLLFLHYNQTLCRSFKYRLERKKAHREIIPHSF
ncbi:hypothetical protein J6590_036390 [Homalodisca vitripennis]|nr:hypothetical protein J6590_036390 [Homalodisca vitripennis]